jgi:hypothetical protein
MGKTVGPVWIVQPDVEDIPHPAHPIVLPPDTPPDGNPHPEHPIVLPPDVGIWPEPPERPDIEPPDPDAPRPEHPIVIPPDVPEPPDGAHPAHPIYINAYPDNSLPPGIEAVGELDFYQRKTLGINWDPSFDPAKAVGVYASDNSAGGDEAGGEFTLVRTVPNDGTSSVTYPQDFTGVVSIRVAGINGYLEGTATIT